MIGDFKVKLRDCWCTFNNNTKIIEQEILKTTSWLAFSCLEIILDEGTNMPWKLEVKMFLFFFRISWRDCIHGIFDICWWREYFYSCVWHECVKYFNCKVDESVLSFQSQGSYSFPQHFNNCVWLEYDTVLTLFYCSSV